jgi:alanine racemase
VTMDQILVDCGPVGSTESVVARGDEVVLIGSQGDETITAWDWATKLDTIAYEITCGISKRVPRVIV